MVCIYIYEIQYTDLKNIRKLGALKKSRETERLISCENWVAPQHTVKTSYDYLLHIT